MRGADYKSDYGVAVNKSGMHSLVGRLGVVLGRRIHETDGKHNKSDYHFKANLWREFQGNGAMSFGVYNSYGDYERLHDSGYHKDTWLELGIGGNVRINKKTHIYGDVLKTFGAKITTKWQVNAGVRWEW